MFLGCGTGGSQRAPAAAFFIFCPWSLKAAHRLLFLRFTWCRQDGGSVSQKDTIGERRAALNGFEKKRFQVEQRERFMFMKDIAATLLVTLIVLLSLISLLTAERSWEATSRAAVSNPERVSDLGLRFTFKE
jgi:hypothetical protein